jgi:hypothetical protein
MAVGICLPKDGLEKFKQALVSGKIDPEKLSKMTSEARHELFGGIVGQGDAKTVNSLFEAKLLLKNQQAGYLTWAKTVAGLKPETRRTMEAKIAKLEKVLSPTEEQAFLKDLAATKLGVDVSVREAKQIANLSSKVQEAEALPRSSIEQSVAKGWKPSENDLKYGYARYDFHQYLNSLNHQAKSWKLSDFKGKNIVQLPPAIGRMFVDTTKSIGASLDDSFALRQGSKSFWTENSAWRKQFGKSFINLIKALKSPEKVDREFNSRLMADPAYDQAVKDGLAIRGNEDVFPPSLIDKIPNKAILAQPFKASEVAYNAFAQQLRLQVYKNRMRAPIELGSDMPKGYGKNMAKMVNSLTGRGGFGKLEPISGYANVAFYSLRFLKSNIDTLLLHPAGGGVGGTLDFALRKEGANIVSAAQKRAATNLAKIVGGTAGLMYMANQLEPGSATYDPRSADFGKIRVGDTRFDLSGGMSSIVVLAAQIAKKEEKSSTTGAVTKLNDPTAFKGDTQVTKVIDFLKNKASPVGGVVLDYGSGQDRNKNKPTIKGEGSNLGKPLLAKNYQELKDNPNSANLLTAMLSDFLGVSTNTYSAGRNGGDILSAKEQAFKDKVGEKKFNEARSLNDKRYNEWLTRNKARLSKENEEEVPGIISYQKGKIQSKIYKDYGFNPKAKSNKTLLDKKKSYK